MHKYVDMTFFCGSCMNYFANEMLGVLIYLKKRQESEFNWHEHACFCVSYSKENIS